MGKPFYTLTVGGENYNLAFSAAATISVEEKLGCGLMEAMSNQRMMTSVSTQVTLLWGALQKYQHGMKMTDAEELYDELMVEKKGKGVGVLLDAITGALVAAGFIPPVETPDGKKKKSEKKQAEAEE